MLQNEYLYCLCQYHRYPKNFILSHKYDDTAPATPRPYVISRHYHKIIDMISLSLMIYWYRKHDFLYFLGLFLLISYIEALK